MDAKDKSTSININIKKKGKDMLPEKNSWNIGRSLRKVGPTRIVVNDVCGGKGGEEEE